MTHLRWIVVNNSVTPTRIVCRFGLRADAEMHAQALNKLNKKGCYKVCFESIGVLAE
jgi:hypothetical protein